MNLDWAYDFSYNYFEKILQATKSHFESYLLSQAPQIVGELGKPKLILRHDIDVSLKRALTMARIEKDHKIRASYMVMTESSLYRIDDDTSRNILQKIIDNGHEIGLHIDPRTHETGSTEAKINSACVELENIISLPVLAVSFHRPLEEDLNGPLLIDNRVNAYAKDLGGKRYRSDSSGRWRFGNPLLWLKEANLPLRQLLIHPIWWGSEHMSREERLRDFVLEEARGKPSDYAKKLHHNIIETICVNFGL